MNTSNLKNIAVYGSAFDPIHVGHIDCIKQIDGKYEQIVVVPSYVHAFGKNMEPFESRFRSVHQAVKDSGPFYSKIIVTDIEKRLHEKNPSKPVFTYDVLKNLSIELWRDDLEFIVGPDNADKSQWEKFYKSEEILNRWGLRAVEQRKDVRSSQIRSLLKAGNDIEDIALMVPACVKQHIEESGAYR